jgi:hypothetical protein
LRAKAVETAPRRSSAIITGLKPGANEIYPALFKKRDAPGVLPLGKLLLTMSGPVLQLLRVSYLGDASRSQPNKREPITFILTKEMLDSAWKFKKS